MPSPGPAVEEEPELSLWTSWILAAAQNAKSPNPTNSQEALEIFGQFHNTISALPRRYPEHLVGIEPAFVDFERANLGIQRRRRHA